MIAAFLLILGGVALFLLNGLPLNTWKWMEEKPFETGYGVTGMVRERQKALHQIDGSNRYRVCLSIITMISFIAFDLSGNLILLPESYFAAFGFGIAAIYAFSFSRTSRNTICLGLITKSLFHQGQHVLQ